DSTFGGGLVQTGPMAIPQVHADAGGTVTLLGPVSGQTGVRVYRLTAAGDPDLGFGQAGHLSLLDDDTAEHPVGIIDRPGGGVIVAATGLHNGSWVTSLAALTSTGALDTSWAPGEPQPGVLVIPVEGRAAVADGDGVAFLSQATIDGQAVFRVTSAGALDPGFGVDGRFDMPGLDVFIGGALTADGGALYVVGDSTTADGGSLDVLKLLSTGSLDPTFGVSGIAYGARSSSCGAYGLAIDVRSGQIVAGGFRNGSGCAG